jgi:hypothetical protein
MQTLATIDLISLECVSGGAEGTKPNVGINLGGNISETIRDVGNGAARAIGCTASAVGNKISGQPAGAALNSWGSCIQTGQPIQPYTGG